MSSSTSFALPYLGGTAVGLVLGVLVIALGLPAPAAAPASSAATQASPSICDVAPEPLAPLRDQADQAELHARILRGQIALLGGIPEPWPDGTDIEAEKSRVLAAIQGALTEHGYGADHPVDVRVDCSEDPCLAQIVAGPADDRNVLRMSTAQYDAARAALGSGMNVSSERTFEGVEGQWMVLTVGPKASETARKERIRVRATRLHDEVQP